MKLYMRVIGGWLARLRQFLSLRFTNIALLLILIIALALRLWGLAFGLPYAYHPDESRFVMSGVQMIQTGDLNPGWFYQPSLYSYLVMMVQAVFFMMGVGRGWFITTSDVFRPDYAYLGLIPHPEQYLLARGLTVLFALATVLLVYRLTRRIFNRRAAMIAASLLSISQLHVSSSHFITTDVPVTMMIVLAVWFCVNVVQFGRVRDYILAGLMIGLACSMKYNAFPAALALIGSHLWRWQTHRSVSGTALVCAFTAAGFGFLMGTPYALLDLPNFLNGVAYEVRHNILVGHPGYEGDTLNWYLTRLLGSSERWIALLSIIGLIIGARLRKVYVVWLSIFPIAFLLVMSRNLVHFERYLVLVIPFMAILSGYALDVLLEVLRSQWPRSNSRRYLVAVGTVFIVLMMIGEPLLTSISYDLRLSSEDIRTTARNWIISNVPQSQSVLLETYGPPLQSSEYNVTAVRSLADVAQTGVSLKSGQYVIASSAMYGRFAANSEEGQAYARLLNGLTLLVQLKGPFVGEADYTIEVYRVP